MITLYESPGSSNCYKVRLLLHQINKPFKRIDVTDENSEAPPLPLGHVPAIKMPGGGMLAASNAILCYLSEGTPLWPVDREKRAQVLQWLFWEQYYHEPYIALTRTLAVGLPASDANEGGAAVAHGHAAPRQTGDRQQQELELEARRAQGQRALKVMDEHLHKHTFFIGDHYTVADIALYAATHAATEAGLNLSLYPSVLSWIGRVQAQSGYVSMDAPRPKKLPKLELQTEVIGSKHAELRPVSSAPCGKYHTGLDDV